MPTRLYLNNDATIYTPPTRRGAWDVATATLARWLAPIFYGAGSTAAQAETSTNTAWDVLVGTWVTNPITRTGRLEGTVSWVFGALESNAAADFFTHVHIYATVGQSDTVRGTLLSDYVGSAEWPTTAAGLTDGTQTLAPVDLEVGDVVVVELGYRATNNVTTSRTGTINYGASASSPDLGSGDTAVTSRPGWVEFSDPNVLLGYSTSSVIDSFTDNAVDGFLWPSAYGTFAETSGQARVSAVAAGTYSGYESYFRFTFAESEHKARVIAPSAEDSTFAFAQIAVYADTDYDTYVAAFIDSVPGEFGWYGTVDGVDFVNESWAFQPGFEHLLGEMTLRLRESGGTLYFDYSVDGGLTWTQRASTSTPSRIRDSRQVCISLEARRSAGSSGAGTAAIFDDVNLPLTGALPGVATGAGAAFDPAVRVAVPVPPAAGSGAALAVSAGSGAAGPLAAGSGAALQPSVRVISAVPAATGSGAALALAAGVAVGAGHASGAGAAQAPTVQVRVPVPVASGSGAAFAPQWDSEGGSYPGHAVGTGTAYALSAVVAVSAGHAAGAGVAAPPTVRVAAGPGLAAGVGVAHQPAVSTAQAAAVPSAAGVGVAYPATPVVGARVGLASGVGVASPGTTSGAYPLDVLYPGGFPGACPFQPPVLAEVPAAAGSGSALQPGVVVGARPGLAAGAGSALQPTTSSRTAVPVASGSAAAFAPTVVAFGQAFPAADVATGAGVAFAPAVAVRGAVGHAAGSGAAHQARAAATAAAGLASGSGTAHTASARAAAAAGVAAGAGVAHQPTVAVRASVGGAAGAGAAFDAVARIAARAGLAAGDGAALQVQAVPERSAPAGRASGSGTAHAPTVRVSPRVPTAAGVGNALFVEVITIGTGPPPIEVGEPDLSGVLYPGANPGTCPAPPGYEPERPSVAGPTDDGWGSLIGILADIRAQANTPDSRERDRCPNDGMLLVTGGAGDRCCRFCGYRPGVAAVDA